METIFQATLKSPIGALLIEADSTHIIGISFLDLEGEDAPANTVTDNELHSRCIRQLSEYFLGKRKIFDLSLKHDGSEFQEKVWKALEAIPFGKIETYSTIARIIKNPAAAQAVGKACGSNPMLLIVPCHRAVGLAKPSGYSGGNEKKEWLLRHEK